MSEPRLPTAPPSFPMRDRRARRPQQADDAECDAANYSQCPSCRSWNPDYADECTGCGLELSGRR